MHEYLGSHRLARSNALQQLISEHMDPSGADSMLSFLMSAIMTTGGRQKQARGLDIGTFVGRTRIP